jgi:hypothetical protein
MDYSTRGHRLSDDDATFIMEMKEDLITDLRRAGCVSWGLNMTTPTQFPMQTVKNSMRSSSLACLIVITSGYLQVEIEELASLSF